jgi:hypothetical protein
MTRISSAGFTRSYRKIILLEDVPNLGFKGETVFVKPGHAFNTLVPAKKALFASDPDSARLATAFDVRRIVWGWLICVCLYREMH